MTAGELNKILYVEDVPNIAQVVKLALGAVYVIPKPFDPITLAENVREVRSNY